MYFMSRKTHIFAVRSDLEPGLKTIEAKHELAYTLCGLFENASLKVHDSLLGLESLGFNPGGSHVTGDCFLIVDRAEEINVRKVPQRRGGIRYAVDQLANPKSIVFWPGGLYQNKGLISGSIGTASDNADSIALYREFAQTLKRGFERIREYWVGPEASRLLDGKMRLMQNYKSPPEFDLKRPN